MFKNFNTAIVATLFLAFFLCSLSVSAQRDLRFGIQMSPTFSGMSTNDNLINRDGSNLGLKLGVMGEFYFSETYSFHSGIGFHFNTGGTLFYENQFTKVDIWQESLEEAFPPSALPDSIGGGIAYKYDLQYLEIPLGLTLRTREFGYIRYFVRPAIHLGIVTQARGSLKNVGFADDDEDFDIGKEVNGVNLSWSLGAGLEYNISENTALIGGLAFQSGFADVTTDKGTSVARQGRNATEDDSKGKVNVIVITLGIMF